ncbi:response regulator [Aquabacterium sp.]|uniref:response regulator n=1 Tax=Aquabacterium sp. TaxID=1872578 RepID=UPI004037C183
MSKTILVVDDSGTFRQVANLALSKAGYTVIEAVDGRDACSKLSVPKLDLIICDVNMPHMDGIEFAKRAKASAHKFTPILMITTESRAELKAEGKAAGVRGWIVKPFQPSQLLDAVNKLCS